MHKNIIIFAFQANIYAIIFAKILNIKIITRSNSSPSGWSKNPIKKILFRSFDTFKDKNNFFSYRRSLISQEKDYGRCLSVISLNGVKNK